MVNSSNWTPDTVSRNGKKASTQKPRLFAPRAARRGLAVGGISEKSSTRQGKNRNAARGIQRRKSMENFKQREKMRKLRYRNELRRSCQSGHIFAGEKKRGNREGNHEENVIHQAEKSSHISRQILRYQDERLPKGIFGRAKRSSS